MTVTVVNALESEEPNFTPLTFVLKDQTLVTVRFTDPQNFPAFVARSQKIHEVACSTGEQKMFWIAGGAQRMADALERVAAEVDQLSRGIFRRQPSAGPPHNRETWKACWSKSVVTAICLPSSARV